MIPVDEARERILATVVVQPVEAVPLAEARGRVAAVDVVAEVDVPPFRASAMDGFAVRAADTGDEVTLAVAGRVVAGGWPDRAVGPGEAVAVATGAPLPDGADAVALIEDAVVADGRVTVRGAVAPGRWVRRRGADLARGDVVVARGSVLTPARVGLIASLGRTDVVVHRRPRVVVVTTGDEVVRPPTPLGPGQIWGSNHLVLLGLLADAGAVGVDGGHAVDDRADLRRAFATALDADAVITTGGVSVGERDLVREVLGELGVDPTFWKVRMKPGKPIAFGVARHGGRSVPVFGLPGNPVSCAVGFLELVRPWLRAAQGDATPHLPVVEAVAAEDLPSGGGRARFERVVVDVAAGGLVVRGAGDGSSGVLSTLARANGLVLLGPAEPGPRAGDRVRVQLFDPAALAVPDGRFGW